MHITRLIRNFLQCRKALQAQNFSTKELHTIALQTAIEYEKLYLQENQNIIQEEQIRAKTELEYINAHLSIAQAKAQVLNTLIQCQSMIKSLGDNAAINRANAYVSFLQVVGNATNAGGITLHSNNVISTINQIGLDTHMQNLKEFLDKVTNELNALQDLQNLQSYAHIYAPSLETTIDQGLRIYAFSTLQGARNYFTLPNGEIKEGKSFLFETSQAGLHKITFTTQRDNISDTDSIEIKVRDEKFSSK